MNNIVAFTQNKSGHAQHPEGLHQTLDKIGTNLGSLYKVYTHIELEENAPAFHLEIIDGYLHRGESLKFVSRVTILNRTQVFCFEVIKNSVSNTFIQLRDIPFTYGIQSIVVLIKNDNEFVGYQCIDYFGNILHLSSVEIADFIQYF